MNAIAPNYVVDALVQVITDNKVSIGVKKAVAISEDAEDKELQPPYCAAYANFELDSEQSTGEDMPLHIPVEIKILCSSKDNKSAALSFAESFRIANSVINLLRGPISVTIDSVAYQVEIHVRKKPFEILKNTADQTIVQANLYYEIDTAGAD